MSISAERIQADIDAIAACTDTPGSGASRPTFSESWRRARDYVIDQANRVGCSVKIDAFGNVHARPSSFPWDQPGWLCGSHIDTVPRGGNFDGVAGVVVALEVLRSDPSAAIELIIFAEEEGTTFGFGMMGSRAWVDGGADQYLSSLRNSAGLNYSEAGKELGVDPSRFATDRIDPARYRGLIEVHIEQGPGMWKNGQRVAIVRAIAGRRQYRCTLRGVANHAGSTSMSDRHDALVGAATLVLQFEGIARGLSPHAVMTVGRLNCRPNAVNVIPDEVEFTLDFRAADDAVLAEGHARIEEQIRAVTSKRGLTYELVQTENQPAVLMNEQLCAALSRAAQNHLAGPAPITISGALHDSAILAPHVPTAMVFVASKDGVSHNPAEFSRVEDIALAARIVGEAIKL